MPKSTVEEISSSIERNRSAGSTLRIRDPTNSYKCYDSIPTPSPISPQLQINNSLENNCTSTAIARATAKSRNHECQSTVSQNCLQRAASLDSLVNSSEQETSEEDDAEHLSDSDSLLELTQINDTNHHHLRQSDLVQLSNDDPQNETVIKAYLEKSHKKCDYKNCGFRQPDSQNNNDIKYNSCTLSQEDPIFPNSLRFLGPHSHHALNNGTVSSVTSNKSNRRNSIASASSVPKMETILEEPIEAKVSVKEILARFETLREAAETHTKGSSLSSGARAAAQTLNVPIERLEQNVQHHGGSTGHLSSVAQHDRMNGHHHIQQSIEDHHQHIIERANSVSPVSGYPAPYVHRKNSINHQDSIISTNGTIVRQDVDQDGSPTHQTTSVTKHSLLQFAIQHFRNDFAEESKLSRSSDKRSSGRTPHADLVKWQGIPLRAPLLRLPPDISPLALECFDCILRYSMDLQMDGDITEVKCVYTILMHCHKHLALRDEVYCQLMKQTTANRSPYPESSQRAWRLLSILAAYFGCSDALRPYLTEHLTSAASDRRRSCHGTATVCLANLRKTARCGGRKNVPSVEEVTAVSAGRSARRQIYRLPGGAERVVNTRCSTVVSDVIGELCSLLGIDSEAEQQEFSLYCIVQGDAFTMPLAADEYILDVTTELLKSGQPFYLIFCRSVWHFPLKRDPVPTPLYIEVLFNQVAPDYLEGLLLELPGAGAPNPDFVRDMARIAAILHRAADLNHVPAMKEIKFLLPKPALGLRELRPAQWVALVQSAWPAIASLSTVAVKAQFLNILSAWPLFGSSFFAIKRVWADDSSTDDPNQMWKELILALNRKGVLFLDPNTHETLQHWSYTEVISTRKVRSEDGALFLDMKVGNLLQQRITRVQTEQAHEISRLVRQYITMAQAQQRDRNRD